MRKFLLFVLVILLVFSSTIVFAEEGDIIHTGLKKLFKASDNYKGLSEAILSGVDKSLFYREDLNGNYVNIMAEENAQLDYLSKALAKANIDVTDSEALIEFVQREDVINALKDITEGKNPDYPDVLYKFEEIPNVGKKEEYYGPDAKIEVEKQDMGVLEKGSKYVGAIKINDLDDGVYKIIALDGPLSKVYEDDNFPSSKEYNPSEDFVVLKEDSSFSNFVKYVYLFKMNDGKIESYNEFVVDENEISLPPTLLEENTNYIGPVKGTTDGTTQFTKLGFENYTFKYKKAEEIIPIPIENSKIDNLSDSIVSGTEIQASPGECLLLVAVDNEDKVVGYSRFILTEEQIKGITPVQFEISPEKGNKPNTTMVKGITLENENNKWMYAIGKDLEAPVLDKVYPGAKDYTLGTDIKANTNEILIIFETDSTGKVKRFGKAKLDENVIKASLAKDLILDTNFRGPVKGNEAGTTKFEFLYYEDLKFIYFVSEEEMSPPEMDSTVNVATGKSIEMDGTSTKDMEIFKANDPILKSDTGFIKYIQIIAID
ncbi:MAG: hypothetical protein GX968_01190, partial [Tissierellia bacterium]|nr:hypothetical protein [Tissierellia bacterium]